MDTDSVLFVHLTHLQNINNVFTLSIVTGDHRKKYILITHMLYYKNFLPLNNRLILIYKVSYYFAVTRLKMISQCCYNFTLSCCVGNCDKNQYSFFDTQNILRSENVPFKIYCDLLIKKIRYIVIFKFLRRAF